MKHIFQSLSGSRAVKLALVSLVLLVVIDGVLTNILVRQGIAREWNPFLVSIAGEPWLVVIKIVGALVCALVLWDIYRHWQGLGAASSYIFLAVYTGIVLWNGYLVLR